MRVALSVLTPAALIIGGTLITPLFPLAAEQLRMTSFTVTGLFVIYVATVMAGLVLFGRWSDVLGRRALLVPALALGITGDVLSWGAGSVAALAAGRIAHGLAVALAAGASAAALADLLPHRRDRAVRLAVLSTGGGMALGPVVGGALSSLPAPLITPFAVHIAFLVVLLVLVGAIRPRRPGRRTPHTSLLRQLAPLPPRIAPEHRDQFRSAGTIGLISYCLFGYWLALAPGYALAQDPGANRAFLALFPVAMLGSSVLAQLLLPATRTRRHLTMGLLIAAAGLSGVVLAICLHSTPAFLASSTMTGAGQGLAFRTGFARLTAGLPERDRSGTISAFYLMIHSIPGVSLVSVPDSATVSSRLHEELGQPSQRRGLPLGQSEVVNTCGSRVSSRGELGVWVSQPQRRQPGHPVHHRRPAQQRHHPVRPGRRKRHLPHPDSLGAGGDNSNAAPGAFFEGTITSGYASNDTIADVQSNIASVTYTGTSGGGVGVGITRPGGKCVDVVGDDNDTNGSNVDLFTSKHDAGGQHRQHTAPTPRGGTARY